MTKMYRVDGTGAASADTLGVKRTRVLLITEKFDFSFDRKDWRSVESDIEKRSTGL